MQHNIYEQNGKVILEGAKDFNLVHTFDCGQCFRWNRQEDGSYTGVAMGRILNVSQDGDRIIFDNTNLEDFSNIWIPYFDLNRDYRELKRQLAKNDKIMKKAITYGDGIRILKQDEWETLISFIISSNRGISMIKKSVEALSHRYGKPLGEYKGKSYYDFPTAQALLNKSVEEIQQSHTGYRAKFIVDAAVIVAEKQMDIYNLKNLSTEMARVELMRFSGVGPKVSDCILLFSMKKSDAFPIDVWVKRVMEYFYLPEDTSLKNVQQYAKEKFGQWAGFAQQYLFYYAREQGIGK